ncbi:MAG: hypothetical protein GC204_18100 [Chloroflexi bacterium]|nr:hypothetical protein [Chloroflexota bacterium]
MLKLNKRRLWLLGVLLLLLVPAVMAQGQRTLVPGTPQAGALDENNLVQVYTLQGSAGQVLTFTAADQIGVPLALVLTDSSGATVAQAYDKDATGQVTLTNVTLPSAGAYFVTVFKSAGVESVSLVEFTLTAQEVTVSTPETTTDATSVEATATPESAATSQATPVGAANIGGGQLLTSNGLRVQLSWTTTDDLDLEVRDPIGGSLYWETPTVSSGGSITANANQGCANTTSSPSETASWTPGGIPTGSYEVLVYFQKACAGQSPVSFTISTTVDGKALDPVEGSLLEGQVFDASFVVNADGTSELTGLSGVVNDQLPADAATIMAGASPIEIGIPASGTITNQQSYQAYSFEGQANDQVTIDMNADSGSLDTFLFLLDSTGNIVSSNDDRAQGNTDAEITNALLPSAGTYTIVATRYAKRIGGTQGNYSLTLTSQGTQLSQAFLDLPRGSLEVRLLWNNAADLQMLVRDPASNSVYVDKPQIASGGQMTALGNNNCTVPQGTPFSYIYWPTSNPPRAGVYELQIWFKNECNDTTPVTANLYVTYNGKQVFTDTIRPLLNDRYLTSFTITADGQVVTSDGGIITGVDSLDYQPRLEGATVLHAGTPQSGTITQDNKFDVYVLTGTAGETYSIAMNNTSGNLDPSLYVIGPAGNQVAANDDAVVGENTNSLISNFALPANGQYIIIATHFGARYGGTTGTYSLTLTKSS